MVIEAYFDILIDWLGEHAWRFCLALLGLLVFFWVKKNRFQPAKLNIKLGGIGKIELTPVKQDRQIAHKIWVELVTRKAAIPLDPEHDVIIEVFESWYQLFGRVRLLIADIDGDLLRKSDSTRKLVSIATTTLNEGLRPLLTKWQARYRHWYETERKKHPELSPQDLQKTFPDFDALMAEMLSVNEELREYANELRKLVTSEKI